MNRVRIIGLVMIIIGILVILAPSNDLTGFITGALLGGGIVLLATGKTIWSKDYRN